MRAGVGVPPVASSPTTTGSAVGARLSLAVPALAHSAAQSSAGACGTGHQPQVQPGLMTECPPPMAERLLGSVRPLPLTGRRLSRRVATPPLVALREQAGGLPGGAACCVTTPARS